MSIYSKLNSLLTAANNKTGESDTTLTDVVQTLIDGYGQGGTNHETEILDGSISGVYTNSDLTSIKEHAFRVCTNLTGVDLPNVTTIGTSAFYECTNLRNISFPKVTTLNAGAFYGCRNLLQADFPLITNLGNEGFRGAWGLIHADLGSCTKIPTTCISESDLFDDLILRKTDTITILNQLNGFNTNLVGHVYVPKNLIATYQTATNWSNKYAEQSDLFRGLEDYTVDGTTTGALDETKAHPTVSPAYTLSEQYFNGTSDYIDTGVQLFDTDGKFTIVMQFEAEPAVNPGSRRMLSCFDVSQSLGFEVTNNGNAITSYYAYFKPTSTGGNMLVNPSTGTSNFSIVIRSNGLTCVAMLITPDKIIKTKGTKTATGTVQNITNNLILGARYNVNTYDSFWKGTIRNLKVYKSAITGRQIYTDLGLLGGVS